MMKLIDRSFLLEAAKSGQSVIWDDTDRWSAGMDQYLTSVPSVLIMVRNLAATRYACAQWL